MNKSALRSFATNARRELLNKVKSKAMKIGITEEKIKKADVESSDAIFIDGRQLSSVEKKQRQNLIKRIEQKGYNQVMEEVAYTWFNRFTALRFMEVNEYLPSNVRVLSSANPEDPIPDIIKEAMSLDFEIDKEWVYERKVKNENDKLFQYLIIKQCNDLNNYLPFMFEKINDYTEILFPEGLLLKDSFLRQMTDINVVPENDWENVEIIGWLYQYYIADEKDRVIQAKKKYKTEEIPFATQLFTPEWIVRYMVQNSLGRYWVENHPGDRELIKNWEYFLENPNPVEGFEEKLAPYLNKELKVEEIKCFDPAMGSGHILVYMFEVLYEIYSRSGYLERDIPRLIIENNLYGLDIDNRAYQLACFSVVMKAMQYNNKFLKKIKRYGLELNLIFIKETNELNNTDIEFISNGDVEIKNFFQQFINAQSIGSLLKIKKHNLDMLKQKLATIEKSPANDMFEEGSRFKLLQILPYLIKQATIMEKTYDVLVTNPPYIGNKFLPTSLREYMKTYYNDVKSDVFSAFLQYSFEKVKRNGHLGFMTPFVWMFISSYQKLRNQIIESKNISSLVQLEYSGFEEATVPICTFTIRNYMVETTGEYVSLTDFRGSKNQPIKTKEAAQKPQVKYRYSSKSSDFDNIPGSPIAYWSTPTVREIFNQTPPLREFAPVKNGLSTTDNNRFLRIWSEVDINKIGFALTNRSEAKVSRYKWFPYNKGGGFRKWYGNIFYVVNWEDDGNEIRKASKGASGGRIVSPEFYFKESISWSKVTSGRLSLRYFPNGFIFDVAGTSAFPEKEDLPILLGFLNSNLSNYFIKNLSQTLNFEAGHVGSLPIIRESLPKDQIKSLVSECIEIAKSDWDAYETSWGFNEHPIVKYRNEFVSLKNAYNEWKIFSDNQYKNLLGYEEELNKLYIRAYGLDEEISHEVERSEISVRVADPERDIKSLISYGIGCILGRYSLDHTGLVYAGGNFEVGNYQTIKVDEDNILPILPGAYFEDDIVARFVDFIKVTFGEETLEENLDFIAETLGKKKNETAKETIRRYFLKDFFKDHVQTYKKRPIYWLFTSGKQKAFNCLIYMHRYDSTTLGRIRTDYLHELQTRMDAEKESLMNIIDGDSTSKEINQAKKELKSLEKKIEELKDYDEVLHHMADQQIEIDLDDGVEFNYEKFKGLLAKK